MEQWLSPADSRDRQRTMHDLTFCLSAVRLRDCWGCTWLCERGCKSDSFWTGTEPAISNVWGLAICLLSLLLQRPLRIISKLNEIIESNRFYGTLVASQAEKVDTQACSETTVHQLLVGTWSWQSWQHYSRQLFRKRLAQTFDIAVVLVQSVFTLCRMKDLCKRRRRVLSRPPPLLQ